jgi:MFS transporter, DHA1 family, multidrug resistance protein
MVGSTGRLDPTTALTQLAPALLAHVAHDVSRNPPRLQRVTVPHDDVAPCREPSGKVVVDDVHPVDEPCVADSPQARVGVRTSPALIAVLVALNALAPFSIDMYLSAFPRMAKDLHASTSSTQLSLTAFLIGLACGQLIIGQLSDRFGRRTPLIVGSAICFVASVLCALAPSIQIMIGLRVVQGFAGASGVVIARAVIADLARGRAVARLFSTMNFTSVLAPMAAPMLGGLIATGLGWRAVFVVLAVMNLGTLLGVLRFVNESLPEQRRRPSGLKPLAVSIRSVLTNRHYLGYTTSSAFITAAMFAYVSASPFVLQDVVGLSPIAYSYTFTGCSLAVAAGSAVAGRAAGSIAPRRALVGGVVALVTITALVLLTVTVGGTRAVPTIALMGCFMAAIGFVYGHANMLATTEVPHAAGTGSAILGFLQYTAGAIVSPLVGVAGRRSAIPMGGAMFATAAAAAATLLILTRGARGREIEGGTPTPLRGSRMPP